MRRIYTMALGTVALVIAQGCSKEAALYLGGPAGPMAALAVSSSRFDIRVGQTVTVGAKGVDAVGNMTTDAPTFSACDAAVSVGSGTAPVDFSTAATITGAGLGSSCVNVSSGGLTEQVVVNVGPTALKIVGDPIVAYNADNPSENGPFEFSVAPVDGSGNALTGTVPYVWGNSDPSKLIVDADNGTIVQTLSLGSAQLSVMAPGGANDAVTIKIAAPAFSGTVSANTGNQGTLITLNRAASGPVFDANTVPYFNFGGVKTFIESMTADQMVVVVPTMNVAGRADLVLSGYGPDDLDRRVMFTSPSATWKDRYAADNETTGGVPVASAPEVSSIMTAGGNVYMSHSGHGTGRGAAGPWNGGSAPDHYFKITTGATAKAVTITASWFDGSDVDLSIQDAAGTDLATSTSGSSTGEGPLTFTFGPNTTLYLLVSMYDAGSNNTNIKVNFSGL